MSGEVLPKRALDRAFRHTAMILSRVMEESRTSTFTQFLPSTTSQGRDKAVNNAKKRATYRTPVRWFFPFRISEKENLPILRTPRFSEKSPEDDPTVIFDVETLCFRETSDRERQSFHYDRLHFHGIQEFDRSRGATTRTSIYLRRPTILGTKG